MSRLFQSGSTLPSSSFCCQRFSQLIPEHGPSLLAAPMRSHASLDFHFPHTSSQRDTKECVRPPPQWGEDLYYSWNKSSHILLWGEHIVAFISVTNRSNILSKRTSRTNEEVHLCCIKQNELHLLPNESKKKKPASYSTTKQHTFIQICQIRKSSYFDLVLLWRLIYNSKRILKSLML